MVLIARNEERHIAAAIESVLKGITHLPDMEIVLVDSASTDDTVRIAQDYPITIVRLQMDWFLSASAGRYIGTLHTRGVAILFLDGDMEMDEEWLKHALPYMAEHPEVAGVTGWRHDIAALYRCSDIHIHAPFSEGFGRAVLEAMACGIPTVVSEVGGLVEIVRNNVEGIVIPPGRSDRIADAVARYIDDPLFYNQCRRNARERVIQCFDNPVSVNKIIEIYKLILSESFEDRQWIERHHEAQSVLFQSGG